VTYQTIIKPNTRKHRGTSPAFFSVGEDRTMRTSTANRATMQIRNMTNEQLVYVWNTVCNGGLEHVNEVNLTPVDKWIEILEGEIFNRRKLNID
jgi:hypothetical protein